MLDSVKFVFILSCVKSFVSSKYTGSYPQRSLYNKLTQEEEFQGFAELIHFNNDARVYLLREELTAFIPTNEAFEKYDKPLHSDLSFYHIARGFQTIDNLKSIQNISILRENFPKLWISEQNDDLYVNNARIIPWKSNYFGITRNGNRGKQQVLHIIDDILDPVIRNPMFSPTAYDFITKIGMWDLEEQYSVAAFLHKLKEHNSTYIYQAEGANTYFIPIDGSITPKIFSSLNQYAVFGHIIPNYVLFTRPTTKGLNYETMANDNSVYMVLSMEESGNKLYVRGTTVSGTGDNPRGEVVAEILYSNIPVLNGVIHLISKPLGIFQKTLKPFPYLPIMEKLATDPNLGTVYEMGEETGFNKLFTTHNVSFTYFVPNDFAWRQIQKQGLKYSGGKVELLKKHLVISQTPYTMENLLALSSGRNYTNIELKTVGGYLTLLVLQIENNFYIKWSGTYIKVVRPNYECTDGFIHILAGPIADLS